MRALPILAATLAATLFCLLGSGQSAQKAPARTRIGTYDNRAIAVAYAGSRFNPVAQKMQELRAAEAAKDQERVRELQAFGEKHQRALHRQGFGRAPVDDLLEHVRDRLPELAREHRLDAIAWQIDYSGAEVERVDVTEALVALYEPSAQTLATIAELKKHAPADLDEIERGHDH